MQHSHCYVHILHCCFYRQGNCLGPTEAEAAGNDDANDVSGVTKAGRSNKMLPRDDKNEESVGIDTKGGIDHYQCKEKRATNLCKFFSQSWFSVSEEETQQDGDYKGYEGQEEL